MWAEHHRGKSEWTYFIGRSRQGPLDQVPASGPELGKRDLATVLDTGRKPG